MTPRMAYLGLAIALAGVVLLHACAALASDCASFDMMRGFLAKQYDEHPTKVGQVPLEISFVVLFESAHGTASFVVVDSNGIACLATGVGRWQAWPDLPPWRDI